MTLNVLIAVTHLLGAGHLTRAAALGRAFAGAGHAVTLVSGGRLAPLVRTEGLRVVQLPPVHVEGTAFSALLGEAGEPASPVLMQARRRLMLDALAAAQPDVVITELFPFGRRALAPEFLGLVERAKTLPRPPLVLASIRDILVAPARAERAAEAHQRVESLYDAVLVHGDPAFVPLEASWPVDDGLRQRLHYTGYVDEAGVALAQGPRRGIVVSAGSGAAGLGLTRAATAAAALRPELGWRILVGSGIDAHAFAALQEAVPPGVVERARADFRALLGRAQLSVSQAGYNTAADLLATCVRAVLVPFEAGAETEQRLRAERLAAHGLGLVLPEAQLSGTSLLASIEAALALPEPVRPSIDLDGARRSVAVVEALAERRREVRQPAMVRPVFDWTRLRALLDEAADRSAPIRFWWRDDDAVAHTPALDRLLGLARDFATPVMLACIPAQIEASLGVLLRDEPWASAAVHGFAHANHAPEAKKAEFGPHRPLPVMAAEAAAALGVMQVALGRALLPVFVPPWNRIAPDLAAELGGLGYRGLSAIRGHPRAAPESLIQVDADIDPIDWQGTRGLADSDAILARLAHAMAARRQDDAEPIGLLTHHLVHDEALWRFTAGLLEELARHPAIRIEAAPALFTSRNSATDSARPASNRVQGFQDTSFEGGP